MIRKVLLAFVVSFLLCSCGHGSGGEEGIACPAVDADGGPDYYADLFFGDEIPNQVGRDIAELCPSWRYSETRDGGLMFRVAGANETGSPAVVLTWFAHKLDSWTALQNWRGKFDGVIEMGMTVEDVRRLRPQLAEVPLRTDYFHERLPDKRELFFYFDYKGRLYIIFAKGDIEGQWF